MKIYLDLQRTSKYGPDLIQMDAYGTLTDLKKYGFFNDPNKFFNRIITFYMDDGDVNGNSDNLLIDGKIDSLYVDDNESYYIAKVYYDTIRHESDNVNKN